MPVLSRPYDPAMTLYVTVNSRTYRVHRLVKGKRAGEIVAETHDPTLRHYTGVDLSEHDSLRAKLIAIFGAAEAEAVKQNLKSKESDGQAH